MTDSYRILRQHVETDRLLGVESVPFNAPQPATIPHAAPRSMPTDDVAATASVGSPRTSPIPHKAAKSPAPTPPTSNPAPTYKPQLPIAANPLPRETKLTLLQAMDNDEVRRCTKCRLSEGRNNTVFGQGNPDAQIMFIGEGPGQNEDETGIPFVGRAGELLTKMIIAMGLSREDVFIANIVKCRPPENRAPLPDEVSACWDYLRRQIATINPAAIVTLGGPATKTLLGTKIGITALRGIWHPFNGLQPDGPIIPVMPTFHPAYVLRAYTVENRGRVWSDLKAVLAFVKGENPA